ncbi:MAG TPA: TldD/PmbA family protein [candidate division Zixibacteria bacterium]|nr:TldD/PmbA family protein [candidate division Zixibacteria bacterium]
MKDKLLETIDYLKSKGVQYADIRFSRRDVESIKVTNENVDTLSRTLDQGFGIRVLADGAWGFASSSKLTSGELKKVSNQALKIAQASAITKREDVKLDEGMVYNDHYKTPFQTDPFKVRLSRKINMLMKINQTLQKKSEIKIAESSMAFFKTNKIFVNTDGSVIEQDLMESGAGYTATAVEGGEVQKRSFPNSHGGDFMTGGFEVIENMGLQRNANRVREEAIQLLSAPPLPAGEADIIIGASQMALQVHESCGHPTELDRVLGTEISLAGGSFMSLDKLGSLQYGSDKVTIVHDATCEGGLGTFGYDDEGVKAQRMPLVDQGRFVGYLTSRETAGVVGQNSNGCMRADGWNRIPLIRMTNINLEPGEWELEDLIADTEGGFFLDTNKSWSIDDKRLNFQFGVEAAWEIRNGKLKTLYKNPLYTGITPQFWNSCDAICNKNHWHIWGVANCGKGEPMQVAHVAHGTSPARFRKIQVGVSK